MKITRFTGINNVKSPESLAPDRYGATALSEAVNVDIGLAGELRRREAFTSTSEEPHDGVWEGAGFLLAVVNGDLVRRVDNVETVISSSVGTDRMWYVNFPDGRTGWNNGTVRGIAGLASATDWGIEAPDVTGVTAQGAADGELYAGDYLWAISYVRADRVEGCLGYGDTKVTVTAGQSFEWTDLPTLAGHTIRLYLTHHNGAVLRLAGETADDSTDTFTFDQKPEKLQREALTEQTDPAPAGRVLAFWRGHALVADGPVLYASLHGSPEHFNLEDHKLFSADITLVQPVEAGIFVGTEEQLVFLRGQKFSELAFERSVNLPVVLGSGCTVPGHYLIRGDGAAGQGECMVCICGGFLATGYQDGAITALTESTYKTQLTEVWSAFRVRDGIPQYVAVPR